MRDRRVLKRRLGSAEAWRGTRAGMWAWLIQRLAALGLLAVIALHLQNPFVRPVQAAVLALVLLHGLLGVRAILLDFGLPARVHRTLFLLALLAALVGFIAFWRWRWY
jgi:succinate dehydrogenase hydrophobic anchor subunit